MPAMARKPSKPTNPGPAKGAGDGARAGNGGAGGNGARALPGDARLLRMKQLCERRAFRERDLRIEATVAAIARDAARAQRRGVGAAEAWERAMPAALVAETWIESAGPSQLLIGVSSASAAYAVDRALRAGALATLREALGAPALRVRTRLGRMPGP